MVKIEQVKTDCIKVSLPDIGHMFKPFTHFGRKSWAQKHYTIPWPGLEPVPCNPEVSTLTMRTCTMPP